MAIDRVTVSLDEDAKEALDDLTERTGHGQSELLRRALTFYAANYQAATTDAGTKLGDYHKMLSGGEHVLLDVDFLHCFLDYVSDADGEPDPDFLTKADQVSEYHAHEYDGEFETLDELLEWLSLCGFLSVRRSDDNRYHVV
ncbi:ribbon-helix-helix protein, CopG family, partial [Halorubrum sp. SP9]